jgi:hypothetical protein
MEYKVRFVCPKLYLSLIALLQCHQPVLPNLQKDLVDAYKKTLSQSKK